MMWLSDLVEPDGKFMYDWDRLGSRWAWVRKLALRLGANQCPKTGHWMLLSTYRMGNWLNENVDPLQGRAQPVWGEGLRVGALVWDADGSRLGEVSELGTLEMGATILVRWQVGGWCCPWSHNPGCGTCQGVCGHHGRRWKVPTGQGSGVEDGESTHSPSP